MRIGSDFEKIQFDFANFQLLEPNAFIGDVLIFILAMYLAMKIKNLGTTSEFHKNWWRFFMVFGLGFFVGGFGHLVYNYTGVPGKLTSWIAGIVAVFFIEQAMLSIHPNPHWKKRFVLISKSKLIIALMVELWIFFAADLVSSPAIGLVVPTANSVIGMGLSLGFLGYHYSKTIDPTFRFLWISALILLPSAIFQGLKINIHPWFDKNDFSHVLLMVSIYLYYRSIKEFTLSTLVHPKKV
ncbi:MAG: hypothetical protein WC044_02340 [Crocinitomicaceae bacterium]